MLGTGTQDKQATTADLLDDLARGNQKLVGEWGGKALPDGSTVPQLLDIISSGDAMLARYAEASEHLNTVDEDRRIHMCAFANSDKILIITPPGMGFIVDSRGVVIPAGDLSPGPEKYHRYNFRQGTSPQMVVNLVQKEIRRWADKIRAAGGGK